MVAKAVEHARHEERDDMQHIQMQQRLLAMRVIAPPKSRLGKLINERLAQLYDELGESIDPAKRGELRVAGANQDVLRERDALEVKLAPRTSGVGGQGTRVGPPPPPGVVGGGPAGPVAMSGGAQFEASGKPAPRIPAIKPQQQAPKIRNLQSEQSQPSWVWLLSQLLQTDLDRLGVEPDELNDIRILLIKNEATQFDKLQMLSRLPDSLSPDAVTKIFEDIRTMAAGYVAFVLVERVKAQVQRGEEVKQLPVVPRSISNPFFGIPLVDFDPEDILRKIDQ
jgi:hypothetical protein